MNLKIGDTVRHPAFGLGTLHTIAFDFWTKLPSVARVEFVINGFTQMRDVRPKNLKVVPLTAPPPRSVALRAVTA